jgi:Ion channel
MFRRFLGFWSQEHSLSALLAILSIRLFVMIPTRGGGLAVAVASDLIFALILLAGLFTMAGSRTMMVLFSACVILWVAAHNAWLLLGLSFLEGWDFIFSTLAMLGMLMVTLRMVYQDGPVTAHRIRGAVAGYLLLGILFAKTYALIHYLLPGALNVPATLTQYYGETGEAFYYFSIVTLTTVGFGDVTAVAPLARSFVMAEALIGQLYPAILIARLVSLAVAGKMKE